MLIVDDMEISREILSLYFCNSFKILEAENGKEALEKIEAHQGKIDIILLDLSMPQMGGREFLAYRRQHDALAQIPVVIITASNTARDQVEMFKQGIDDYITKPFVPEVVDYRIRRVINGRKNYYDILNEKQSYQKQAQLDSMTGLYNKETAEKLIDDILHKKAAYQRHAMLVFDIDKFKMVNDTVGHLEGDKVIKAVTQVITASFRHTDVVGRIGGDEFVVLMLDVPSKQLVREHAHKIIYKMNEKRGMNIPPYVTLSIGIAYTDGEQTDYAHLFEKADKALYECKMNGRNQYYEYGSREKKMNQRQEKAYIVNSDRSTCNVIENAMEGRVELISLHTMKDLLHLPEEAVAIFIDISEERDSGRSIMEYLDEIWVNEKIPVVVIYQDGNMAQCRNALSYEVSELLTVPINESTVKRIMDNLLVVPADS